MNKLVLTIAFIFQTLTIRFAHDGHNEEDSTLETEGHGH